MNSSASWRIRIRGKVFKALSRFPPAVRNRFMRTIEDLLSDPYAGDIEKMKNEPQSWRRRIGAYRIFYEIIPQDKIIYVFRIERRTSKTY